MGQIPADDPAQTVSRRAPAPTWLAQLALDELAHPTAGAPREAHLLPAPDEAEAEPDERAGMSRSSAGTSSSQKRMVCMAKTSPSARTNATVPFQIDRSATREIPGSATVATASPGRVA